MYENATTTKATVIHDPRINVYVSSGKLNLSESEVDSLELTVNHKNPLFAKGKPFITHVEVYRDNDLEFRGRLLQPTREMKSGGQFVQSFTFESIGAYLTDSVQRFKEYHNISPKDFFKDLINTHNNQVPDYEKFEVRNVDVTNSTDNVYRFVEYDTTGSTIKEKLTKRLGGFIVTEYKDGKNYIDYLNNPGKDHKTDQPIQIALNMKTAKVVTDPTKIITRLVPLGATQDTADNNGETNTAKPRLDIKSVNGGKDYIDIPQLQNLFGIHVGTNMWDDVTDANNLKNKANEWIKKQIVATDTWTVDALELPNIDNFKVSDRYMFKNDFVAETQLLRVIKKSVDLTSPNKTTITIGDKSKTIVDYQLSALGMQKTLDKLKTINAQEARKIKLMDAQIKALQEINAQLRHDLLVSNGSGGASEKDGPTDAVNGDWKPVIRHAAKVMQVSVSDSQVNQIAQMIQAESGGDQTVTQKVWDINMANGNPAQGLLQYVPSTFNNYKLEGHGSILKGWDQLLAFFNNSNWAKDIRVGGWGPTGSRRFTKVPEPPKPTYTSGAETFRQKARQYLGVPYVWGGGRPVGKANPKNGMDCSSYVAQVYHDMGISIPAQTVAMEPYFHTVSSAQTGDVGFYGSHGASYHVCLFLDANTIIFEPQPGQVCKQEPVSYYRPSWIGRNDAMAEKVK